jgi:hypothetical protein
MKLSSTEFPFLKEYIGTKNCNTSISNSTGGKKNTIYAFGFITLLE